jgi:glutamate-ammonia-ligase adenylyltransferase
VRELPDAHSARLLYERVMGEHGQAARVLTREAGLLSDVLALAAWSPLLATTLEQNPEYFQWLARERQQPRVKTREELGESLARFNLTHSQLDPQVLLARFRRRELLRIYLRDIRRLSTLVEITEELSNLADAVLGHALSLARQELDNRYGTPLRTTEKGRTASAAFAIVALGKLGSFELNYASDIDLMFIYSDEGETSGKGTRGETTNREYFVKLAEMVARLVGSPSG